MKEYEITLRIPANEIFDPKCIWNNLLKLEKTSYQNTYITKIHEVLKKSSFRCDMYEGDGSCIVDVLFTAEFILISRNDFLALTITEAENKIYSFKTEYFIAKAHIRNNYKIGDKVPVVVINAIYNSNIIKLSVEIIEPPVLKKFSAFVTHGGELPKIIAKQIEILVKNLKEKQLPDLPFPVKKFPFTNFNLLDKIDYSLDAVIVFTFEAGWLQFFEFENIENAKKKFEINEVMDSGEFKYEVILKRLIVVDNLVSVFTELN